ncbi:hypothetical protein Q8A67_019602 [Cirrhinus molitorella]|uniref:Uncharacterized protein n=1 Tax=Cirrhinus molitorella TaxID=172907 RepID=A0AA88PCQ7_9TELE|nr:hypothetical protein Q8A67_019602 [Cirrhinus molitorella]
MFLYIQKKELSKTAYRKVEHLYMRESQSALCGSSCFEVHGLTSGVELLDFTKPLDRRKSFPRPKIHRGNRQGGVGLQGCSTHGLAGTVVNQAENVRRLAGVGGSAVLRRVLDDIYLVRFLGRFVFLNSSTGGYFLSAGQTAKKKKKNSGGEGREDSEKVT